jgi:tetratricopeptide (TPR) repeat protein
VAEGAAVAALSLDQEGGSPEVRAEACWGASRVFAQRSQWEAALELANRARCLLDPISDRVRVAELRRTSASLCLRATPPRLDEAGHHLVEAEAALASLGRPIERSRLHLERAHLALLQGQAEDALADALSAQSLGEPGGPEQARSVNLAGMALAASGRHREARRALQEAAERYGGLGAAREQARCHRQLGELALVKEDWRGAAQAFRRALEVLDSAEGRTTLAVQPRTRARA